MRRNRKWWIIGAAAVIAGLVAYAVMESSVGPPSPGNAGPQAMKIASPSQGGGTVTLIELGASECIPCKMMAPIIEELKQEYAGKAEIRFIDVWKYPERATQYGVKAIPTLIFFDGQGKEVYRHTGFMDKERIVEILSRLGVS